MRLSDISYDGLIIGQFRQTGTDVDTAWSWRSPDAQPSQLPSRHSERVVAKEIEGDWIAGAANHGADGLSWNVHTGEVVEYEAGVADLNSSRDAALSFALHAEEFSKVVRSDGTTIDFPTRTSLAHIFERGNPRTVAGTVVVDGSSKPVLWSCDS